MNKTLNKTRKVYAKYLHKPFFMPLHILGESGFLERSLILEYSIGVLGMNINLYQLLQNRLSARDRISGQIMLGEPQRNYICVSLQGKNELFELSEILADIIMENLQVRYIMRQITSEYYFVEEKDQSAILVQTIKKLWHDASSDVLENSKSDISRRIAICLLESEEGIISLDGILNFRMKDCISEWRQAIDESIDDFLVQEEKKEFIKMLRYFVSMQEPTITHVQIQLEEEEYTLFDESHTRLRVPVTEDEVGKAATKEDILLSRLISLAPESIDAGAIGDDKLKTLLKDIFIGRVRG